MEFKYLALEDSVYKQMSQKINDPTGGATPHGTRQTSQGAPSAEPRGRVTYFPLREPQMPQGPHHGR